MKEARKLLRKAGLPLYRLVIAFSLIKEYVLIPLMSLIWKFVLMTTPDGFISNANLSKTLIRSPWIVLFGILLLATFLLFSMWQVSATVLGVAYAYEGKTPRVRDLLIISIKDVRKGLKPKNVMLVLYIAIILPFTNVFQASNAIGAFVIPEYIQDYIDASFSLTALYFVAGVAALYIALRWLYVLPSFFLKRHDFFIANKESLVITKKKNLKNCFFVTLYGFLETIRLAFLPYIIVVLICSVVYLLVIEVPYAKELFVPVALKGATEVLEKVCGVMVYLSVICFIVQGYYGFCKENDTLKDIHLPEITKEAKTHKLDSFNHVFATLLGTCGIALLYLIVVWCAQIVPDKVEELLYKPIIVAHKGYSSRAPENTMDSFELADKAEVADFMELDVWSSKDGIPVVIHNESVKAATGLKGNIYDYTYEELCNIPAPYAMDINKFPEAKIPSLEEVISTYADSKPLIIEIKGYKIDEKLPEKIVELMEKYDCTETSMIHSSNYAALKAVKMCNPNIRCGLIQALVTGECYDLPYADFYSVEHTFVTSKMIREVHKRGKKLFVWTVNYSESIDSLNSKDVDGFITDYPDKIANAVSNELEHFDLFKESVPIESTDMFSAQSEFEAGNY